MQPKETTVAESVSGEGWTELQEQQGWDDFLAWCREQENSPHE